MDPKHFYNSVTQRNIQINKQKPHYCTAFLLYIKFYFFSLLILHKKKEDKSENKYKRSTMS